MNVKSGFGLVKESFKEWKDDGALDLGASLAYYTIFSLAPMLLIATAVAGLVWGREAVQGQLVGELRGLLGPQGAEAVQTMIANAGQQKGSGIFATVLGIATILFGATGVFAQLQNALNRIWNVKAKPKSGIWSFIRTRLLSFGMVLGIGFLLLVSLAVSAAVSAMGSWATSRLPGGETIIQVLTFVLSFALITGLLAMIYKYLPDVKIGWRDVIIGAVVTALLFTVGKFLIGLYLGKSSVASTYGAAGSLVILLLWIYYSSQILFLGAEFTQVYASRYGSQIRPSENAVPVIEERREASPREWPPNQKGKGAPERPSEDRRKTGRSS